MEEVKDFFIKVDFAKLLDELNAAKNWFEAIDCQTTNTRFEDLVRNVSLIIDREKSGTLSDLLTRFGEEILCYSLTESVAFIEIHRNFRSLSPSVLRKRKLKEALGGPFLPKDEIAGDANVNSRNTLFELELAAKLMRNGVAVTGFDDFEFAYKQTEFIMECKRPFSEKNFQENVIDKAVDQLNKRLITSKQAGIIAISVEKLITIDKYFEQEKDIMQRVKPISDEFVVKHSPIWRTIQHPQIIAILLIFKFVHQLAQENLFTPCYLKSVLRLKSKNDPQNVNFLNLKEILEQIEWKFD